LRDHLVRDVPTLPASFLTCLVADAATKLRPHLKIVAYEDTRYHRFVKLPRDGCAKIRIHARVVSESHVGTAIHVRILSDFVHKSGRPLQTDILHNETTIRMAESLANPPKRLFDSDHIDGIRLPDPYLLPDSKVRLNGPFASTRNIAVGRSQRVAQYHLANCRYPQSPFIHMLPNMIFVDAFWRFGTVHEIADHTLGVYVPERCGVMRVYFDYMAFDAPALTDAMTFRGFNPRAEGDVLHVGPIEVSDREGKVMLVVEQGLCRKLGEVQRAS